MIGLNAKLYYGSAGATASTELNIVKEVTPDSNADDIVSAYRESRFKSHEAGQIDLTLSVTMKLKEDNAGYQAFLNAHVNGTLLAVKILSKSTGGGWDADWCVLTMSEPQPIDGVLEVTFGLGCNTDSGRSPVRVAAS